MHFVAVDVETANARMRSICQVGVVVFEGGQEIAARSFLVDPREEFDLINVGIHGIEPEHVEGAPTFPEIVDWLHGHTREQFVVSHTQFDRTAIAQAIAHHGLAEVACNWIDSAKVARRAWPEFAYAGFGLRNLAREFDIPLQHHDALHDARAAGMIMLRAISQTGLSVNQWVARCRLGISGDAKGRERREGDGDGPLVGETVVFTGELSMIRRVAADLAHEAGARVEPGLNKHTSILVVGDQDLERLNGKSKSGKHLKAEKLAAAGQPIRFLAESDFLALITGARDAGSVS